MGKIKKTLIILAVVLVAGAGGFFGWKYYSSNNAAPVKVFPFNYVGMTEYWGDTRESYGPVTTDKIQTVFLSDTQTVSKILVKQDQQVKKGDLLMSFDTTLSQLELERKELEIQKKQMDLEEAQKELQRISWMAPMGTPPTEPETEPTEPDLGRQLQGEFEAFRDGQHDGSSEATPFIAWIPEGKVLTPEFLQGKVRVSFACTPAEAEVKVFSAGAESGAALVPEQDGTYLLSPGSYSYQAGAEGYETFQDTFQVDLASGALRVEITLEPSATDPSETEPSTEEPTNPEGPTEPSTEGPTETPTEGPTEGPTENPTETPTQAPTEDPTQAPTQAPTENPTETPTENPTETPTQEPVAERVRVEIRSTPQELRLTVYPADADAQSAIKPEADGSYLLLPGEYAYQASADGYDDAQGKFTVPTSGPYTVEITLSSSATQPASAESTPAETEAETQATEPPTQAAPATEAPTEEPPATQAAPELTGTEELVQFLALLSEDVSQPSSGLQPPYYVVFKITRDNMLKGDILGWIGVHVYADGSFSFFNASGIEDFSIPVEPTEPVETEPEVDYFGSGYTYSQIQEMKKEQEQKIKDLDIQLKLAQSELKIMQKELSDGNIYAEQDGKVISLLTEEEAKLKSQPIIKLSSGGGYYIDATLSELERNLVKVGQEVTVNSWDTGMTYTGTVVSISDVPSSRNSYNGNNNPNASSYPFRVFVDESADLQAGNYVNVQYSSAEQSGIYLEKPFLRTEDGQSVVYARGEDGLLERRVVTVGKSMGGYYVEIKDGLTEDDMVAFPYGKNVKPGVPTEEGDYSDMYN